MTPKQRHYKITSKMRIEKEVSRLFSDVFGVIATLQFHLSLDQIK